MERHLLFRHLENNHNEFESLPIENKIHKAIQTVVLNYFYICPFLLFICFCNSTSKNWEYSKYTFTYFSLSVFTNMYKKKMISHVFIFFFIIKISTYNQPSPFPFFLHCHSFQSFNCTSAFFLWKAIEAAHGDDGLRWMYYAQ